MVVCYQCNTTSLGAAMRSLALVVLLLSYPAFAADYTPRLDRPSQPEAPTKIGPAVADKGALGGEPTPTANLELGPLRT